MGNNMLNTVLSSMLQTHQTIHCIMSICSKPSDLYNNPLPSTGPARTAMSLWMSATCLCARGHAIATGGFPLASHKARRELL